MNTNTFYPATVLGLLLVAGALPAGAQAAQPAGVQSANVQAQGQARTEALFGALDTNKDKVLSLPEFQAGYASVQRTIALDIRLREQFRTVDVDRSGAIEAGEYANLVLVKQAGAAAPGLAAFDANKNQKLEFAEYLTVVRRLAASPPAARAKQ